MWTCQIYLEFELSFTWQAPAVACLDPCERLLTRFAPVLTWSVLQGSECSCRCSSQPHPPPLTPPPPPVAPPLPLQSCGAFSFLPGTCAAASSPPPLCFDHTSLAFTFLPQALCPDCSHLPAWLTPSHSPHLHAAPPSQRVFLTTLFKVETLPLSTPVHDFIFLLLKS